MPQHISSSVKAVRKVQKKHPLPLKVKAKRAASVFDLLRRDHHEIQKLCKTILDEKETETMSLHQSFNLLKELVLSHDHAEEAVVYHKVLEASRQKQDIKGHRRLLKAFEEHRIAGMLINEMSQIGIADERFMAKMHVLSETLSHHFKGEELTIFKSARTVLSAEVRSKLAKQFMNLKNRHSRH